MRDESMTTEGAVFVLEMKGEGGGRTSWMERRGGGSGNDEEYIIISVNFPDESRRDERNCEKRVV